MSKPKVDDFTSAFAEELARGMNRVWNKLLDEAGITDPKQRAEFSQAKVYLIAGYGKP